MLKKINEAFEKAFVKQEREDEIQEGFNEHEDLRRALEREADSLMDAGDGNLKKYEVAFQSVIEDFFPDKSWWEVVDFNIFYDLFNNRDPYHTIDEIIAHIDDGEEVEEGLVGESKKEGCVVKSRKKVQEARRGGNKHISAMRNESIRHRRTSPIKEARSSKDEDEPIEESSNRKEEKIISRAKARKR